MSIKKEFKIKYDLKCRNFASVFVIVGDTQMAHVAQKKAVIAIKSR